VTVSRIEQLTAEELSPAVLATVGDMLDAGVVVVDSDLVVRGWNHWMVAASGLEADVVIGRPLADTFPGFTGTRSEALFRKALAGETVLLAHRLHEYLLDLPAPVGLAGYERMQQSARILPGRQPDGSAAAVAFIQDVTDRVAREDELRVAKDRAEAASQAKSDFLAATSHELRTPLTAVIGYADLLDAAVSGPLTPQQRDHVARIKFASWHLIGIIDEILTFSRAEAKREPLRPEVLDPADVARHAVDLVQPQAEAKGLSLELVLPDARVSLVTDAGKLRQILVNLLTNAVKFTSAGAVSLELELAAGCPVFRISDTGPGIDTANLGRIFEPFTQLDQSSTRTQGGTGLGLPLSRTLAQLLGGEIEVTSQVGSGSTFELRLPAQVVHEG
jgi:signal transduction histidine kinase